MGRRIRLKERSRLVLAVAVIVGVLFLLDEILSNVDIAVNHQWWGYRAWKFYWAYQYLILSFVIPTILALFGRREEDEPTRAQLMFTWNTAVAGFWLFIFGILWTIDRLGGWLGIPVFMAVCVPVILVWQRLDARFGYLNRSQNSS